MPEIISLAKATNVDYQKVLTTLQSGAIIAYPTDTIYGLGVDAFQPQAVRKLLQLKGRTSGKPVSVLYADVTSLLSDFKYLNDYQQRVVRTLLPGKITLILPIGPDSFFPEEITIDGTVGVRVITLEPMNRILRQYPHPITTTSVNPADAPPARSIAEIISYFDDQISLILEYEIATDSLPSTLVKVGESKLEIIRFGAVSPAEIEEKMRKL
ncbi:MAG TPA: L-threonylcarbamoyladenylate synthase [Candidatus Marinimicrobia bacterium]|nr:L-threonylcarbamoyladenylate synthase [Candidatus Neomarinimicrobiota bacterium]HRS52010.1 L-threonylcarbamoyladenylate synthase [Candidatus Neomarinimicrobiota bacterium]HRU91861.1 L-threonylcarbamoyladenylate synthase [Candidatus Neomarinimicrobiota bacterium]